MIAAIIKSLHRLKNFTLCILYLASCIFFFSCKKTQTDTDTQAAEDNAIAEQSFHQAGPTVVAVGIKEEGVKKTSSGNFNCAIITVLDSAFPKRVQIDFGTGCADNDGRTRKGIIRAEFSNYWDTTGSKVTINFVNYYVDNINIQGIIQMTNNGNHSYTTVIQNGKIISSSSPSFTIEYACNQTHRWIAGYNTDSVATDDVFEISGNANGVNRNGVSYSTVIMQALRKEMNCKWIVKGQVTLTPEGKASRTINFGDGACDNKAVVTINGKDHDILLP